MEFNREHKMKLSTLTVGMLVASLALSSTVYARNNGVYTPKEHISCALNASNKVSCGDFDHNILIEYRHTAVFNQDQEQSFTFRSASAYVGAKSRIFFTYSNGDETDNAVTLATIDPNIQPDLASGSWKPVGNGSGVYRCDEGYMNCGIINLPQK
jgi:hypothetical protein